MGSERAAARLDGQGVVVEAIVNAEKLEQLLAIGHESERLDFKQKLDLGDKFEVAEIAKDVAAMQLDGGYIVIGVDDQGKPSSLFSGDNLSQFDEANLRPKLEKYIPTGFRLLSGIHEKNGSPIVLICVMPNSQIPYVMEKDCDPSGGQRKNGIVFRAGDVLVRHGTSSERWQQSDVAKIVSRIVAREKEAWRKEHSETMIAALAASSGTLSIANGPYMALDWGLDLATFRDVVVEQSRRKDKVPLTLLFRGLTKELARLRGEATEGEFENILDKIAQVGILGLSLRRKWLFGLALDGLRLCHESTGKREVSERLEVFKRALAVGAYAVRLNLWQPVRMLFEMSPKSQLAPDSSWLAEAHYHAYDSQRRMSTLVSHVSEFIRENEFLRPDLEECSQRSESEPAAGRKVIHF